MEITRNPTRDALPPLDSLKCALCGEFLKDPMTLQCMHSYCQSCLAQITPPAPPAPEPEKGGKVAPPPPPPPIECTICVNRLKLPVPETYTEPFENNRLTRIVRLVHESNVLCQNCQDTGSELRCSTCQCYLCSSCWKETHSSQVFQNHKPEALRHDEMDAVNSNRCFAKLPKCPEHPNNELEFFCTGDEIGVCQACLLKGSFVGRAYRQVGDVCKERRAEIENGITSVAKKREELVQSREATLNVLQELGSNLITVEQNIESVFAKIRLALDKRERETVKAVRLLKHAKDHVLQAQVKAIDRVVSGIDDGVKSARLVVDYSNDLELVYLTYVMQNHINVLSQLPGTSPIPCQNCTKAKKMCHCPSVSGSLPVQLGDSLSEAVEKFAGVASADSILALLSPQDRDSAVRAASEADSVVESSKNLLDVRGVSDDNSPESGSPAGALGDEGQNDVSEVLDAREQQVSEDNELRDEVVAPDAINVAQQEEVNPETKENSSTSTDSQQQDSEGGDGCFIQ